MTTKSCRKSLHRDPIQWNKNGRYAEDFAVSRTPGFDRDDHPGAFGGGDGYLLSLAESPVPENRGNEYRLELIREIAVRVQQNGSLKL